MLSIIPTPIGNLRDITSRSMQTLKDCDYILCEDTRQTIKLLHHLSIVKKLVPFHKHNEKKLEEKILDDLKEGKNICLVSDAGTPCINDPGISLVEKCHQNNIKVTSLPGPSSITTALSLSGIKYQKFQFLGFFPKQLKEQKKTIEEMLLYDGVSIFFESPNRIMKTLSLFPEEIEIHVAKELSKLYERLIILTPSTAKLYEKILTKGELCVLVKGKKSEPFSIDCEDKELLQILEKHLSKKDAVKIASDLTGKKKQCFYSL